MDLGFGSLLAANRSQLPSVVIFRLDVETPARVNAHLASVLDSGPPNKSGIVCQPDLTHINWTPVANIVG